MGFWLFSTTKKCFSFLMSLFATQKTGDHDRCLPKLESPSPPPPPPPPLPPVAPFDIEAHQDQNPTNSHNQPHTHSTTTAINNGRQEEVSKQTTQSQLANPIAETLREQDMVKAFLTMIPPFVSILLNTTLNDDLNWFRKVALCLLSLAFVSLFFGICLSNMHPKIANLFGQVGIACTCTSVFMLMASPLPPWIVWLPTVCCIACVVICIFGMSIIGIKPTKVTWFMTSINQR